MTTQPAAPDTTTWHSLSTDETLQRQGVDPAAGLSSAEAESRRAKYGPNKFAEAAKEPRWQAFLRQYRDPMQLVLLAAGVLSLFIPDQVPTLAAVAPFARGTTRITGVPHLRIKESDRLAAMARELGRAGVPVAEQPAGLTIEGVWADAPPPADEVTVETHGDHRIAMSLALVALRRPGLRISSAGPSRGRRSSARATPSSTSCRISSSRRSPCSPERGGCCSPTKSDSARQSKPESGSPRNGPSGDGAC